MGSLTPARSATTNDAFAYHSLEGAAGRLTATAYTRIAAAHDHVQHGAQLDEAEKRSALDDCEAADALVE